MQNDLQTHYNRNLGTSPHSYHWSIAHISPTNWRDVTPDRFYICTADGSFRECCSGCSILCQVKHILMEAKLSEYRARKRREAAKQFLCNMATFNSQQHVDVSERNVPIPDSQEVNGLLSDFKL